MALWGKQIPDMGKADFRPARSAVRSNFSRITALSPPTPVPTFNPFMNQGVRLYPPSHGFSTDQQSRTNAGIWVLFLINWGYFWNFLVSKSRVCFNWQILQVLFILVYVKIIGLNMLLLKKKYLLSNRFHLSCLFRELLIIISRLGSYR